MGLSGAECNGKSIIRMLSCCFLSESDVAAAAAVAVVVVVVVAAANHSILLHSFIHPVTL